MKGEKTGRNSDEWKKREKRKAEVKSRDETPAVASFTFSLKT